MNLDLYYTREGPVCWDFHSVYKIPIDPELIVLPDRKSCAVFRVLGFASESFVLPSVANLKSSNLKS